MPWQAFGVSANPGSPQWGLPTEQHPPAGLTLPYLLDTASLSPWQGSISPEAMPRMTSITASPAQDAQTELTLTSSSTRHKLEQENSHRVPGRHPSRAWYLSRLYQTAACAVPPRQGFSSMAVARRLFSALTICNGRSKGDCHGSRGPALLTGKSSFRILVTTPFTSTSDMQCLNLPWNVTLYCLSY